MSESDTSGLAKVVQLFATGLLRDLGGKLPPALGLRSDSF